MEESTVFIIVNCLGVLGLFMAIVKHGFVYSMFSILFWLYCIFALELQPSIDYKEFLQTIYIGLIVINLYITIKIIKE